MNNNFTCPICGEPTSIYMGNARKDRLCRQHAKELKEEKIEQCLDCFTWHEKDKTCKCKIIKIPTKEWKKQFNKNIENLNSPQTDKTEPYSNTETEKQKNIIIEKSIRCITCGYESDGKLFCKKCYAKYHDKQILIKIKNCKEIEPLDEFYEGYYECDDGHVVKSMAERDIDDYLFAKNIRHAYEKPLIIQDENGNKVTLHPDFCIFDENGNILYFIEYWGYSDDNRDYTKIKKYKIPLYEKAGITLININAKNDLRNLKTNLQYKLENYIKGKINFLDD